MVPSPATRSRSALPIIGLSHVYGETDDLEAQDVFWTARSLRPSFRTTLPVPEEKRTRLLDNQAATQIELRYFDSSARGGSPGFEFIQHRPAPAAGIRKDIPNLRVAISSPHQSLATDPDGNVLICNSLIPAGTVVRVGVPDVAAARDILTALGFRSRADALDFDRAIFGSYPTVPVELFEFALPLFPTMSIQLILHSDDKVPLRRPIDSRGWQGISLLTRDIEEVARRIPVVAVQHINLGKTGPCDVGFFCGAGLLFEFLQMKTRGINAHSRVL
jgi:hypothetical protein